MKKLEYILDQQKQENRSLLIILGLSCFSSAVIHAVAMITPVPTLWKSVETESDDVVEIVVVSPEKELKAEPEEKTPEIIKEPEVADKPPENDPIEATPLAIALAPKTPQAIGGRDAPASDDFKPLTTNAGDVTIPTNVGRIIKENARGWSFGLNKESTGFVRNGSPEGNPNGVPSDQKDSGINGGEDRKGTEVTRSIAPIETKKPTTKLECISCPKPQYRGREGTPRVTYDITPDGKVTNVRLRQSSGDPETDRETMEAMSKWQFNPKTVPEGGRTNVKVRVTFEESGSQFQRLNEGERRRIAEQQRVAEQERQQREAERARLAPTAVKEPVPIIPKSEPAAPASVAPPRPADISPAPTYVAPAIVDPLPPVDIAPAPSYIPPVELPPPPPPTENP